MRVRRYHDAESEDTLRFWSGLILAAAVCIPAWVGLLYGALRLARWAGVIQ